MITDQRAKLEAHHGRPVSVVEAELIECMVDIKLTVPNTAAERLKRANALGRFMLALYGHGKPIERHRSMEEQLAMIDQDEPAA